VMFWGNATIDFRRVGFVAKYVTEINISAFSRYNTPATCVGIINCDSIHIVGESPPNTRDFLDLLEFSDTFDVTDPRDRIFGLLGLRTRDSDPDSGELFIKPNYESSVSEVYENVVAKLLVDQKKIQVLSFVQHDSVIPSDKKSWTIDWDKRVHYVFGQEARKTSDMPPAVCKPVCGVPNCVAIQGIAVDEIGSTMSDGADSTLSKDIDMARRLKTLMGKLQEEYSSEAVAWTLTAGYSTCWTLVNDHGAHLTEYNAFSEWDFGQGAPASGSDIYPYFQLVMIVLSPRRLFTTTKGLLGLGPMIMQEGDIVSVLFGGNVPYVLSVITIDSLENAISIPSWRDRGSKHGRIVASQRKTFTSTESQIQRFPQIQSTTALFLANFRSELYRSRNLDGHQYKPSAQRLSTFKALDELSLIYVTKTHPSSLFAHLVHRYRASPQPIPTTP